MKMKFNTHEVDPALNACLEGIRNQGKSVEAALREQGLREAELRPILEAALWLELKKTGSDPSPGFVSASWKRVLRKIKTRDEGDPAAIPGIKGKMQVRFAFRSALAICLAMVLLLNTSVIGAAAKTSYPGNVFYKVKKAEESLQLAFSQSNEQTAELHIFLMKRRAAEIEEMILEGQTEHLVDMALEFEYHLNQARTAIDYWRITDYQNANVKAEGLSLSLSNQVFVWQALLKLIPISDRGSFQHAIYAASQ